MAKYRVIYDGDTFIDGFERDSFAQAKEDAKDILIEWLADCPEEDRGMMIANCMTWVEEYDEESGEWVDIWYPEDEFLKSIGWIEDEKIFS